MGYRIEYDSGKRQYEVRRVCPWRLPLMAAGAFAVFLLLTSLLWPEGIEAMKELLIPGDNTVTLRALEEMAEDLKAGASISDAVTVFCKEILQSAEAAG